jgi:hypothetical protein
MCMHICIVFVYVRMYNVCIYVRIGICTYVCICVGLYIFVCVCMYVFVRMCLCIYLRIFLYMFVHTQIMYLFFTFPYGVCHRYCSKLLSRNISVVQS